MKIFSDQKYLPSGQGHVVMLYPFWGKNPEDPQDPSSGRFHHYAEVGHKYFELTPLPEADVAVLPAEWTTGNREVLQLADEARRAGKPVVIFFNSDSNEEIPIENSVIFRTSFYRSTRRPNEFALPAWSEDFVERYLGGKLLLRQNRPRPVIGYCGYTWLDGQGIKAALRRTIASLPRLARTLSKLSMPPIRHPGSRIRLAAVHALSRSKEVDTNFVIRRSFWGGALRSETFDIRLAQQLRREFVQNMVESDYVLCARGKGNFSYRLYETLSCGRIPVFIDTDCVLPYDRWIDWKQYCVWIDEKDLPAVARRVAEFHSALSPQDFQNLQIACRKLWEDWISPPGFFANFHRHF